MTVRSIDAAEKSSHAGCTIGIPIHVIKATNRRTVPRIGYAAAQDDIVRSTQTESAPSIPLPTGVQFFALGKLLITGA